LIYEGNRYCCRDHQALDWTTGHKQACGTGGDSDLSVPPANPSNRFLFKEYGIEMDQEYVSANLLEALSDEDDDDDDDDEPCIDDEPEDVKRKRMAEFEAYVAKNKLQNENFKTDEVEAAVAEQRDDKKFERFNRLLNLNPTQVLRYQRGGTPLLATDRAPPLGVAPPCEKCGAARSFELQLMPHLLSLIGVDQIGHSIDWASIYVFTCSQTCEIENNGYVKEFVCKQDFC
ncbi:programmed cell death protein 2 domain protein, partial [Cooperia oncophora]